MAVQDRNIRVGTASDGVAGTGDAEGRAGDGCGVLGGADRGFGHGTVSPVLACGCAAVLMTTGPQGYGVKDGTWLSGEERSNQIDSLPLVLRSDEHPAQVSRCSGLTIGPAARGAWLAGGR